MVPSDDCGVWFDGHTNSRRCIPTVYGDSAIHPPIIHPAETSLGLSLKKMPEGRLDDLDDIMAFRNIKIGELVKLKSKDKWRCGSCNNATDLALSGDLMDQVRENTREDEAKLMLIRLIAIHWAI